MLRQRKKSDTSASSGDLPPSYEETLKVGAGPGPGAGPVTVVRVVTVPAPSLGPHPATMVCPGCQSQVTTATSSRPAWSAWLVAGLLCLTGFWPCFCIPCCVPSLQNVDHTCPHCKAGLGSYRGGGC